MHVFMSGKRLDVILTTMQKFSAHPEILQCGCKIIAVVALGKCAAFWVHTMGDRNTSPRPGEIYFLWGFYDLNTPCICCLLPKCAT